MTRLIIRIAIGSIALIVAAGLVLYVVVMAYRGNTLFYFAPPASTQLFSVQSIDTMKHSRDMAAQILDNPDGFKRMVDREMSLIADAGATHAAIATPYDAHFLPVLRLWVASARSYNLSVWFRGNFSGWEGWFDYSKIGRSTHKSLLTSFLKDNPDLFRSGDVFTPCPECENGGPGDPRQTGDISGYNAFLRDEQSIASDEFARQNKRITITPSMNGDIARQIISPATIAAFGGTILIDHYVDSSQKFARDITSMAKQLHSNIGLGEVGAPIPDLNGDMTQAEQAQYVDELFSAMYTRRSYVPIVNYWVLSGGSTALLDNNATPRLAYTAVQNYYKSWNVYGTVSNSIGENVGGAKINIDGTDYNTMSEGSSYQIFVPRQHTQMTVTANGYLPVVITLPPSASTTLLRQDIQLQPAQPGLWYNLRAKLYKQLQLN